MDFKLDSNGDLDVSSGISFVTGGEELQQRLAVGLTLNLGEFFTHINYGLPWLKDESATKDNYDVQYFLGSDVNVSVIYIVNKIDEYILTLPQVVSVTSEYELDQTTRKLTYTPHIMGEGGELLIFPSYYTLDI